MWDKLHSIYQRVSYFGVPADLPAVEEGRVVILNRTVLIVIMVQLLLYVDQIFREGDWLVWPILAVIFAGGIIFLFHSFQRFLLARFYINLVYPLVMFAVITRYGEALRVDYAFLIFFITSIIFHDRTWVKVALCFYNFGLFLLSEYFVHNYASIKAYEVDSIDPIMVFAATAACIAVIIGVLFQENRTYRHRMENLLASMEQKNTDLSQAYHEIERFSRITSHDLKTPLRTIKSFIGLMERDLSAANYATLRDYFSYVQDGMTKLDTLINGILEYTHIDQLDHIEEQWIDLGELVDELVESARLASGRDILMERSTLPVVRAKMYFWRTLLENLIRNGVMYNESTQVNLSIQHSFENELLTLRIEDDGIGIEPQYHQQIFEVFRRLHHEEQYPGTGIGLAICRKIVTKMQGTIDVQSAPREGTTFLIRVPWPANNLRPAPERMLA